MGGGVQYGWFRSILEKIAIVIVNFRTPELVKSCLSSLRQAAQTLDVSVFVGDADSQDESVAIISDYIAAEGLSWAQCFDIGRNGGFAYGNNAVVERYVMPDPDIAYVYFLNPDTVVRPGAVEALLRFLQSHPKAGIAGSRLEDPDGSPRAYGFRAPAPWREFFRAARLDLLHRLVPAAPVKINPLLEDRQVDWVSGASFMVRRAVLEDVGLMDDAYFLYFEETDLMTRARQAGYEVWHVSDSRVVHLAGQSTGHRTKNNKVEPKPPSPIWLASRTRYLRKFHGVTGVARANFFFLLGDLLYRIHRGVRARPIENPPRLWRSYLIRGCVGK